MFYEERSIRNVLNCELCNYRLEEEPKLLPCAATVCIRCISSFKTIIDNRFKCPICSAIHVIPDEGFPTNKALENILSIRPTEIYRSSAIESFKVNNIKLSNEYIESKYIFRLIFVVSFNQSPQSNRYHLCSRHKNNSNKRDIQRLQRRSTIRHADSSRANQRVLR